MEAALAGADVDGLVYDIFPDALQPAVLEPFLHDADIDIRQWPQVEIVLGLERLLQDRRTEHLVIGEGFGVNSARSPTRALARTGNGLWVSPRIGQFRVLPVDPVFAPRDARAFFSMTTVSASVMARRPRCDELLDLVFGPGFGDI